MEHTRKMVRGLSLDEAIFLLRLGYATKIYRYLEDEDKNIVYTSNTCWYPTEEDKNSNHWCVIPTGD